MGLDLNNLGPKEARDGFFPCSPAWMCGDATERRLTGVTNGPRGGAQSVTLLLISMEGTQLPVWTRSENMTWLLLLLLLFGGVSPFNPQIKMLLRMLAGRAARPQHRPGAGPDGEQREASLHVRLPGVQQTLLQALQPAAAQPQAHR